MKPQGQLNEIGADIRNKLSPIKNLLTLIENYNIREDEPEVRKKIWAIVWGIVLIYIVLLFIVINIFIVLWNLNTKRMYTWRNAMSTSICNYHSGIGNFVYEWYTDKDILTTYLRILSFEVNRKSKCDKDGNIINE